MSNYWYNVATNLHYISGLLSPILGLFTAASGIFSLIYFVRYMEKSSGSACSTHNIVDLSRNVFFILLCSAVICFAIWVLTPGGNS